MIKAFMVVVAVALILACGSGCEITATAYVQQEWSTDPSMSKPDGSARAEVKITRLAGRDAKK